MSTKPTIWLDQVLPHSDVVYVHAECEENNIELFDRIKDRLQPQADAIKLSENKLNYVVTNVMNLATDTEYQILPFDMLDAKEWMKTNMYIDIPGKVRYIVKAYDMARAAVVEGIQYASKHPKEEIRLVIHVGVLGGDAETDYDNIRDIAVKM